MSARARVTHPEAESEHTATLYSHMTVEAPTRSADGHG